MKVMITQSEYEAFPPSVYSNKKKTALSDLFHANKTSNDVCPDHRYTKTCKSSQANLKLLKST